MKKIISIVVILTMCAVLALTTGCSNESGKETSSQKAFSGGVEDIYGSTELTEEQLAAFQNSGEITLYTDKADIAKGKYDDGLKAAHDFYKKYYGLTIKYKYQAYGDDLTKFMVDYANGDAPDYITLNYRRWPKAALRQVVYSVDDLEKMDIVGLDHPEFKKYADLQTPFTIDGVCYSPVAAYSSPVLVCVNTDLFEKYSVKSPVEYYKEGNWTMDTYVQCCKELTRTLADGTKVWGTYAWDYSWYLVANDGRMVSWADDWTLKLTMNETKTMNALLQWKDLYDKAYSPSSEENGASKPFQTGNMGMYLYTGNNISMDVVDYTFNWDLVPMPYGNDNTSGMLPGEISGAGIVTSAKNPQGVINYLIANRLWNNFVMNSDESLFITRKEYYDVYTDEQIDLITSYAGKIDQDFYRGVGNLYSNQYKFWNDLKRGTMTVKEVMDTYQPLWQSHVDEENKLAKEAKEKNK